MSPPIKHDPRIVMPTRHLLDGSDYVKASHTNIRERFDRIRAAQLEASKPANVSNIKRKVKP